jgi:glycosyltransferase involved in cell wall biosynthesis
MQTPCISVITVVLNNAEALKKTMESVWSQTYPNVEYIVIDGGSTDNTIEVIKEHESRISCWSSGKDKGIYDAMNKGLQKATGKWVNFMNAGDYFHNNQVLADCVKYLHTSSQPCDIFYGNFIWKDTDKELFIKRKHPCRLGYTMPSCHQSFFVDRQIHQQNPFNLYYEIAADYDFFLKMYRSGKRFLRIPVTVSVYQAGGVSEISENKKGAEFTAIFHNYNNLWRRCWLKIFSMRLFDGGWRAYYLLLWTQKLLGKKKYRTFAAFMSKIRNR